MGGRRGLRASHAVWALAALALVLLLWRLQSTRTPDAPDAVAPMVGESVWPAGGQLFIASVGLAASATLLALLLAFPVGVHLSARGGVWLGGLSLFPLLIPAHLAAYVWRFTLEDVAAAVSPDAAWWRSAQWSFAGAAWTLAAIYWPVIALPIVLSMRTRGNRLVQELATLAPPRAVFWRAIVPGLAPDLLAGLGVFFLLALANYGVPLMWNVPSQNVAVFARLAAYYSPREALVLSIPLQISVLVVCVACLLWLTRRPYAVDLTQAVLPQPRRSGWSVAGLLAGAVVLVTALVPVASLVSWPGVTRLVRADLIAGHRPFMWGLILAALGATGAVIIGSALAEMGRRAGRTFEAVAEVAGLFALFVPAAVLCLALAGALGGPSWVRVIYQGLPVFLIAYGLRFFYVPWKIVRIVQRQIGREHADLARMIGLGSLARLRLAVFGALRPALSLSWLLVFAFALGELEIATFLVQPGRQPLSVFLDNLMHYGRSAAVVQWSLIVLAAELIIAWTVMKVGLSQWRKLSVAN